MNLSRKFGQHLRGVSVCLSMLVVVGCSSGDDTLVSLTANPLDGREITASTGNEPTGDEGGGQAVVPVRTGPDAITDLVLVTGQSNALGAQTAFDPQLDSPVDRFYAYTENGWELASLRQVWDLGWHPRTSIDTDPHNNFAFHFGKSVSAKRGDRVVGIVLVTAPGEGISHWDRDNFFFNKIRTKALAALNALPHKSQFDGILWHQGETDWASSGSLDTDLDDLVVDDNYYSNKLWQLIDNFRNESWFDYDKPFICGETARSPINARLTSLNRNSDPWTACVEGEGLATYDDAEVHFTAESLRTLGASYADMYLHIAKQP